MDFKGVDSMLQNTRGNGSPDVCLYDENQQVNYHYTNMYDHS